MQDGVIYLCTYHAGTPDCVNANVLINTTMILFLLVIGLVVWAMFSSRMENYVLKKLQKRKQALENLALDEFHKYHAPTGLR